MTATEEQDDLISKVKVLCFSCKETNIVDIEPIDYLTFHLQYLNNKKCPKCGTSECNALPHQQVEKEEQKKEYEKEERRLFTFKEDPVKIILDTLAKEIKRDDKLTRQVLYTILSSGTKNPINLCVNAPSSEGKTYVLLKVADLFSDNVVISLAGMTGKALVHKRGTICVKDKEGGDYTPLSLLVKPINKKLGKLKEELDYMGKPQSEEDKKKINELHNEMDQLAEQQDEFENNAVNVIDLNNKVLIFLDTPDETLFDTLMPLMSHDKYETTYEFVDTSKQTRTKTNILRGFPAFILTQAIDFSKFKRHEEITRRFLISNPNMNKDKYNDAADLISKKFSVPDFIYQQQVVSDEEKSKAKKFASQLLHNIQVSNSDNKSTKNEVIIPFVGTIRRSMPVNKGLDMTNYGKFFNLLSLLPKIKSYDRPKLVNNKRAEIAYSFATFEDLQETLYLMEGSTGVRPFIIEWFNKVFLAAYKGKNDRPDSKSKIDGSEIEESIVAVKTSDLAAKHKEVYGSSLTTQNILERFLYPLINNQMVDLVKSQLDGRAKIYFPINISNQKIIDLFENSSSNNLLQNCKLNIIDISAKPTKEYLISEIKALLNYSSQNEKPIGFSFSNHKGEEISLSSLIGVYYSNWEDYFSVNNEVIGSHSQLDEYIKNVKNPINCNEVGDYTDDFMQIDRGDCKKLFEIDKSNKSIIFDKSNSIINQNNKSEYAEANNRNLTNYSTQAGEPAAVSDPQLEEFLKEVEAIKNPKNRLNQQVDTTTEDNNRTIDNDNSGKKFECQICRDKLFAIPFTTKSKPEYEEHLEKYHKS